jgi:hypothetical protein
MILTGLLAIIANIGKGFFNLVRFKLDPSFRKKQHELFDRRLRTCEACPHVNLRLRQCSICGCFIDAKTKVVYKTDEEGFAVCRIDKKTGDTYYACPKRLW